MFQKLTIGGGCSVTSTPNFIVNNFSLIGVFLAVIGWPSGRFRYPFPDMDLLQRGADETEEYIDTLNDLIRTSAHPERNILFFWQGIVEFFCGWNLLL